MERVKKRTRLLIALTALPAIYLVWWDNSNVYSGIYETRSTDYAALAAFASLGVLLIMSVAAAFKNGFYLRATIPTIVLAIYLSRFWHGPQIAQMHDCGNSVCSTLSFYADGSFYYSQSDQITTNTKSGIVEISGNTLLLIPSFRFSLNWSRLDNKTMESIRIIRPVGFSFPLFIEFDK